MSLFSGFPHRTVVHNASSSHAASTNRMDIACNHLYFSNMPPTRVTKIHESFHYLPDPLWKNAFVSVLRSGKIAAGPEYRIERTFSPGQDLMFCASGKGSIFVDGVTSPVESGDFAWLPGDLPHGHFADEVDPWAIYWVRIDGGPNVETIRSNLFSPQGGVMPIRGGVTVIGWFERLFDCMRDRAPGCDVALNALVAELFWMLHDESLKLPSRQLPAALSRVTTAMSARPGDAWPERELMQVARVSPGHLRRQFRTFFGMSPREWLRRQRMMLAQDLLGRTDASITSISETCGYCDIYHFSREFRRAMGQSPTEWRRAGEFGRNP